MTDALFFPAGFALFTFCGSPVQKRVSLFVVHGSLARAYNYDFRNRTFHDLFLTPHRRALQTAAQ